MTRSALQVLLNVISAVSAAVTIFVAIRSWYPKASPDAQPAILFLCALCSALIVALAATNYVYARRARYGRIVPTLNDIHAELYRLTFRGLGLGLSEIRGTCQHTVDQLSEMFNRTTGRRCAVCIKVVVAEENETQVFRVQTFCRNHSSRDREGLTRRIDHWIEANTDFEDLFADQRRYFFSNWLPWVEDYKNSSFQAYGVPHDRGFFKTLVRHAKWPLPYRSTIVCAVRPRPTTSGEEDATQSLIGYLCVDSRRARTFSEDDDVDVLQGVAESLYSVLRLIKR